MPSTTMRSPSRRSSSITTPFSTKRPVRTSALTTESPWTRHTKRAPCRPAVRPSRARRSPRGPLRASPPRDKPFREAAVRRGCPTTRVRQLLQTLRCIAGLSESGPGGLEGLAGRGRIEFGQQFAFSDTGAPVGTDSHQGSRVGETESSGVLLLDHTHINTGIDVLAGFDDEGFVEEEQPAASRSRAPKTARFISKKFFTLDFGAKEGFSGRRGKADPLFFVPKVRSGSLPT